MKITNEMTQAAYAIAKKVYEKTTLRKEGIDELHSKNGMNKGTASDLISNFNYMLNGERYARTLNAYTTEYFLNNIHNDYGDEGLQNALTALYKHFTYYESIRDVRRHKIRDIYNNFNKYLLIQPEAKEDINEQEELVNLYKNKSRLDLLRELEETYQDKNEKIERTLTAYKRNNKAIALIKILKSFKCQICGISIIKKDKSNYIEAAHIIPSHKKGEETLGNIILLCPNHHKEFDLGNTIDINVNAGFVEFKMNDVDYKIKLSIDN